MTLFKLLRINRYADRGSPYSINPGPEDPTMVFPGGAELTLAPNETMEYWESKTDDGLTL